MSEAITAILEHWQGNIPGLIFLPGLFLPLVVLILLNGFYKDTQTVAESSGPRALAAAEGEEEALAAVNPNLDPAIDGQLKRILHDEIPEMLEMLPSNNWHKHACFEKGGRWRFTFECNSETRRFFASALGSSPMEAFLITRHRILAQIREWHRTRFDGALAAPAHTHAPRVLIVDDDVDVALAMQTAFGQLGCETEVATSHEGLHRKLLQSPADYIFLDWRLNGEVTADQVVEKAIRYIDTFSDLREKFTGHRPRVVTHSVLDREQVTLPSAGTPYFDHLDHWQKPMPFHEVVKRASQLFAASTAAAEV